MMVHPVRIKSDLTSPQVLTEWEQHRRYLGMSAISQCARYLYDTYLDGRDDPSRRTLQYCHEGYLHEQDIIERLEKASYQVSHRGAELVAEFDDRHRGHIDGYLPQANLLLEVKSVSPIRFDQVRREPFPSHVAQVQAYLHYSGFRRALIVYKNRNNGDLWTHIVHEDYQTGAMLEEKARRILARIDAGTPPPCTCGRCDA
jgi:hypothetical protein